ncbi:hypothetical protein BDV12DRAFT_193425 [Aspergillus spectabilis]
MATVRRPYCKHELGDIADMFANTSYAVPGQGGWDEIVNSVTVMVPREVSLSSLGLGMSLPRGEQTEVAGETLDAPFLNDVGSDGEENDYQDKGEMNLESEHYKTAHESCIAAACQTLSSLYQLVRSDSGRCAQPSPLPQSPSSDVVLDSARTAASGVLQMLRCVCSSAHDPSLLSLLAAIISRILDWYQILYEHNTAGSSSSTSATETRIQGGESSLAAVPSSTDSTSSPNSIQGHPVYIVPLTIGTLRLPHNTETKLKAQLLLCELELVLDASQLLIAQVRASEETWGESVICAEFDTHIQQKAEDLKRLLTGVCSDSSSGQR